MRYVILVLLLVGSSAYASRNLPALLHKIKQHTAVTRTVVTDKLRHSLGLAAIVIVCSSGGCSLSESFSEEERPASSSTSGSTRAEMSDEERAAEREQARRREQRRRLRLGERYGERYGDPNNEGQYRGEVYRVRSGDDLDMEKLGDFSVPKRSYRGGDHIYFIRDSIARSGTIQKKLDYNRYVVEIDSAGYARATATVSGHDIIARYRPSETERSFEGENVLVAGDDKYVKYRHGTVVRFYDDGYVEIRVDQETPADGDGERTRLKRSYTIFVDGSLSLAEGGFVFGDSF